MKAHMDNQNLTELRGAGFSVDDADELSRALREMEENLMYMDTDCNIVDSTNSAYRWYVEEPEEFKKEASAMLFFFPFAKLKLLKTGCLLWTVKMTASRKGDDTQCTFLILYPEHYRTRICKEVCEPRILLEDAAYEAIKRSAENAGRSTLPFIVEDPTKSDMDGRHKIVWVREKYPKYGFFQDMLLKEATIQADGRAQQAKELVSEAVKYQHTAAALLAYFGILWILNIQESIRDEDFWNWWYREWVDYQREYMDDFSHDLGTAGSSIRVSGPVFACDPVDGRCEEKRGAEEDGKEDIHNPFAYIDDLLVAISGLEDEGEVYTDGEGNVWLEAGEDKRIIAHRQIDQTTASDLSLYNDRLSERKDRKYTIESVVSLINQIGQSMKDLSNKDPAGKGLTEEELDIIRKKTGSSMDAFLNLIGKKA